MATPKASKASKAPKVPKLTAPTVKGTAGKRIEKGYPCLVGRVIYSATADPKRFLRSLVRSWAVRNEQEETGLRSDDGAVFAQFAPLEGGADLLSAIFVPSREDAKVKLPSSASVNPIFQELGEETLLVALDEEGNTLPGYYAVPVAGGWILHRIEVFVGSRPPKGASATEIPASMTATLGIDDFAGELETLAKWNG